MMPFVASGVPVLDSWSSENVTKLSGGWEQDGLDKAIGEASLGKTEQHNGLGLIWSSVELTHREKFESFWETHKENLNSLIVQLSHKENCTF